MPNDGYVSLINPDGSVHTLKWIGVNRNGLTLNHPLGSDIVNDMLYVADIDIIRWFDMATGQPKGNVKVDGATTFIDDIEVAEDGTIYATQTGKHERRNLESLPDHAARADFRVRVGGGAEPAPNGVAFDPKGNIVLVNIGSNDVLTFSPARSASDDGEDGRSGQRRPHDPGRRNEICQQRPPGHGLAHPSGPAGRARRLRHPDCGIDGPRSEAESADHPAERLERHYVRRAERAGAVDRLSLALVAVERRRTRSTPASILVTSAGRLKHGTRWASPIGLRQSRSDAGDEPFAVHLV